MNLTETQKQVLRWLVEEVRAGNLDEEEIWFTWTFEGTSLVEYKGNPRNIPEVKTTTLDALERSNCLVCDQSGRYEYKYALTGKAYEVVDSNFAKANITQNKLAEKIGIVAQSGSTVNVENLNIEGAKHIEKQINVHQSGSNNTQNNTFNL